MAKNYYAYYLKESDETNIVDNWDDCLSATKGKSHKLKKFKSKKEALDWLYAVKNNIEIKNEAELSEGIYFDAGTGRGIGVEIRVTDQFGKSLLHKAMPLEKINEFDNFLVPYEDATNNYGELLACYAALKIALNENKKRIFGDSRLVIEYWSKGRFNQVKSNLNDRTVVLIKKVQQMREEFEKKGGQISHVSGDINPADLGFHK